MFHLQVSKFRYYKTASLTGFYPICTKCYHGIFKKKRNKVETWKVILIIAVVLGVVWYLNKKEVINWFGEYQFGAELIIYNAIISFIALFLISNKKQEFSSQ